jgi:hypothetical protein
VIGDAPSAVRHGGCQCGAVRYELHGPAIKLVVCHCTECRKQSASAFGVSMFVAVGALRLTRGAARFWSRPTDAGHVLDCAFCPVCGSRLWHRRQGSDDVLSVKVGSLDEPVDLSPAIHIWTSRMLPGLVLPDATVRYPLGPP